MIKNSDITVITPSNNSFEALSVFVGKISKQSLPPHRIIIVHNSADKLSDNEILSLKKLFENIEYIYVSKAFPGKARNIGLSSLQSKWVCFLDVKTLPEDDFFKKAINIINSNNLKILFGIRKNIYSNKFSKNLSYLTYGDKRYESLSGSFVSSSALSLMGLFNENIRAGEDIEYLNRARGFNLNKKINNETEHYYYGLPKNFKELFFKYLAYSYQNAFINILFIDKFLYFLVIFIFIFIYIKINLTYAITFFIINLLAIFIYRLFRNYFPKNIYDFILSLMISIVIDLCKLPSFFLGFIIYFKRHKINGVKLNKCLINATCIDNTTSGANNRFFGFYDSVIKKAESSFFFFIASKELNLDKYSKIENVEIIKTNIPSTKPVKRLIINLFFIPYILNKIKPNLFEQLHLPLFTFFKTNTYLTIHDLRLIKFPDLYDNIRKYLSKFVIKYSLKKSNKIIVVSNSISDELRNNFNIAKDKIIVIENGLNLKLKNSKSNKLDFLLKKYQYILCVNIFEKRKNLIRLIKAFSIVHKSNKDLKLIIIGKKADDFNNVLNQINSLNLNKNIHLLLNVTNNEIESYYKNSKLFVSSSIYEGFGIPLIEATYFNLNVLCSDIKIYREIGDGYFNYFDPLSEKDISEKIISMINDEKIIKNEISRAKIIEKYNYKNLILNHDFYFK